MQQESGLGQVVCVWKRHVARGDLVIVGSLGVDWKEIVARFYSMLG